MTKSEIRMEILHRTSHVRQAATPSLKHHRYLAEEFILATQ
ncbi:hypothetical protein T12_16512 [Trichinella patagoniensis]|uniref:Uncharacterized protein n=1 Tax=Trichinella patagoniensis TaxID=990121 RepID=A0A0V0YYQ1_9BILA|nr:hypothetical protein T12_15213 [Trichinella patagoniensis]KRY05795.1 hypothetical protein T12_16512 [Trichinella patagoniensis]